MLGHGVSPAALAALTFGQFPVAKKLMFAETSARCGFTSLAISTVIGRCGSIHSVFGSAIQTCHKEAPGRAPRASGLPKSPPARPRQDAPQRPRTARINVRFAPEATEVLRCRELTRCARSGHPATVWSSLSGIYQGGRRRNRRPLGIYFGQPRG